MKGFLSLQCECWDSSLQLDMIRDDNPEDSI